MTGLEVWTEKYRPQRLDEVIGQAHVVERLKAWVKSRNVPNMLLAGPAGIGKTTIALALARDLYGEHWKQNFQETNASVTPETPIMIKEDGVIKRTNFAYLEKYFKGEQKYARAKDLEILSLDKEHKPKFMKVSVISRHRVDKIAEIKYEGGKIRTSLNHSVIVMDNDGMLVSKQVGEMTSGDLLLTFCEKIDYQDSDIDFMKYAGKEMVEFKH